MKISDKHVKNIALIFLFLFTFSGVFSIISVKINFLLLRLWKEGLILFFFLISMLFVFLNAKIKLSKVIILTALIIPFLLLYLLFSIDINPLLVMYQIKIDLIPFMYVAGVSLIISNKQSRDDFYNRFIKLVILIGVFNSFFIYFESMFPALFMSALNIEDMNNSARASGVRLDNTLWGLRAMGTMTSFINAGTLTFFSLICLLESKIYKGFIKFLFFSILISAMILTTYKSTIIGVLFYFIVRSVHYIFRRAKGSKFIYLFFGGFFFIFMSFTFLNSGVYDQFVNTKYKQIAYDSIYVRVVQHEDILNEMETNDGFYTGLGLGKNGSMGPDDKLKLTSKPLDSTYIYIMSNYGIIGVIAWLFLLFSLFIYLSTLSNRKDNIALAMLLYACGTEFFINNIFTNFPCNIIFSTILYLSIAYGKESYGTKKRKIKMLPSTTNENVR